MGRIKEAFYREAIAEYTKRLSKYCKLEILEVADEKTPDNASVGEESTIREKEALRILRMIKEDAYVISLEIGGKKLDSVAFARQMEVLGIQGKSHLAFVIGGSLGLHKMISERANMALSFSDMTFPHQLMRVILLEQIYRGFRITAGEPYHK